MPDTRCPMCGKPNPAENVECQFCGSRLKPLIIQQPEEPPRTVPVATQARPQPPPAGSEETLRRVAVATPSEEPAPPRGIPPWLARLRAETKAKKTGRLEAPPAPPVAPPPTIPAQVARPGAKRTTGELFRSLRVAASQQVIAEPEPEEPPAAAPAEVPDWLHSLRAHGAAPETPTAPPPPPTPAPADETPDWLRSLRGQAAAAPEPTPPPTPAPENEAADWLSSLRGQAVSAAEPTISFEEESAAPAEEMPAWLRPAGVPSAEPPAVTGVEDWLKTSAEPPGARDENWLTSFAEPAAEPAPSTELPDWLKALPEVGKEPPAVTGNTDWLKSLGGAPAEPAPASDLPDWLKAPPEVGQEPPAVTGDTDWLKSLSGAPAEPAPASDFPGWMAAPPDVGKEPPAVAGEVPDWLSSLAPESAAPPTEPPDWLTPPAEAQAPGGEAPTVAPDWMASFAPAEAAPSTETAPIVPSEADFDFLPPAPAEPEAPAPFDTTTAGLPDWLAAMRPTGYDAPAPPIAPQPSEFAAPPAPEAPPTIERRTAKPATARLAEAAPSAITKAALPSWLEAMRPIATTQPAAPELEDYEETAGPLAGMRGVLAAEPAVALPTATKVTAAARPTVSETHAAQVKLLEQLVSAETAPRTAGAAALARPILALVERWVVFLVLLAAVAAPFVTGGSLFAAPINFPAETIAARDAVAQVPAELPVLVAFEYEPGSAGELDPQADALLAHLAQRNLRVVTVSTRPAGAVVAQSALDRNLGETGIYTYGTNYVNLGYLPGGSIGLASFAAQPREAIPADFLIGYDRTVPLLGVWQMPAVAGVNRASDFGLIAVIGNSPDAVRLWIEQVKPLTPTTPMIALVSASAEPLVQPYYLPDDLDTQDNESASGPLQGVVSGLAGATNYDQLFRLSTGQITGLSGTQAQRWDAQALGLLAASLVIALGAIVFGALSFVQRRGPTKP